MTIKQETAPYRRTATVVGLVYLAGFVVGIAGNTMIQSVLGAPNRLAAVSTSSMTVAIGAVLWLMAVAGDTAHGILMLPVLRPHSERMAFGYLATRIVDAVFIAIMVLLILIQIPLASEYAKAAAPVALVLQGLSTVLVQARMYAYEIGMSALGFAGLMLCYTLYRGKLVPGWLAIWGLAGYAIILCGMVSAIVGSGLADISAIPGGLWEVFVGVWLIFKGFSPSGFTTESGKAGTS